MSNLPSERVRTLARVVRLMLRDYSDDERREFFVMVVNDAADDGEKIAATLGKVRSNVTRAAKMLGVSRKTLQTRMREFGLPPGRAGRPRR